MSDRPDRADRERVAEQIDVLSRAAFTPWPPENRQRGTAADEAFATCDFDCDRRGGPHACLCPSPTTTTDRGQDDAR